MQWGDGIPRDGTSRKMREYQIRFCEKRSVKFTGLTRQFPGPTRHDVDHAIAPAFGLRDLAALGQPPSWKRSSQVRLQPTMAVKTRSHSSADLIFGKDRSAL